MNKIYKFKSISEATSHIGAVSPNVSYVVGSTNKVVYANFGNNKKIMFVNNNGVVTAENLATPLNFTAVTANSSVTLNIDGTLTGVQVEYSTDNATWSTYTIGTTITLTNINDKVYFRGDNANISGRDRNNSFRFIMTGNLNGSGNIMSLLDTTMALETVPDYGFCSLFYDCKSLLTPPWLPATSVGAYSYYGMFWNCYYLTAAPELPATTLAESCYASMFLDCRSLRTAPAILPATTLSKSCYQGMFDSCRLLTTAPELPATTLALWCYASMFSRCASLTTAPVLPATTIARYCYRQMFKECALLTTAPELPATNLEDNCYENMFYGCTSLTTAPELPATTLAWACYSGMFYGCTSLTNAPELIASTTKYRCYENIFKNCTSLASLSIHANTILNNIDVSGWLDNVYPNGTLYSYGSADFNGKIPNTWNIVVKSPLCFTAKQSNSVIKLKTVGTLSGLNFEYSYDKNTWNNYSLGNTITLSNNSTVYFRGDNTSATGFDQNNHLQFEMSGSIQSSGNVMSLFDSTLETDTIGKGYCISLFEDCTALTEAPALPATTLSAYCYMCMFQNCTSLTTTPILLAETLKTMCYMRMFQNCTSLTSVATIKAHALAPQCCVSMFNGCTNLIDAPILYAEKTTNSCYGAMFENCYSLTELYVFANDISAEYCLYRWLKNTAQNTTGVLHVIGNTDFSGSVPENWSVKNEIALNFTANEANSTVKLKKNGTINTSYKYSTDNENWNSYTIGDVITLANIGDKVYFRGDNSQIEFSQNNYMQFEMTGLITGGGNIMSMFDSIMQLTSISTYGCFNMFKDCTSLTSAPELPATTISVYCYKNMFSGCTSLTTTPDLPATTLAGGCYSGMFEGCTSLTTTPDLPATTLVYLCYGSMFEGCTSLTTASELPATTIASQCYYQMFYGCTSLTTAPALPATTLEYNCYGDMFNGCTSLTTAPALPATTLTSQCYYQMFSGCTSLTTAPELPATTLTVECYQNMFCYCTSLTSLTVYADDISASRCITNWLYGINTTGILYSLGSADFTGKVPANWTISTTPPA